MRKIISAILSASILLAPYAAAAQNAYFRLGTQGKASPTPTPAPAALTISPSPGVPSNVLSGASVGARYVFGGGTPPYQASFADVPAGLTPSYGPGYAALSGVPSLLGANPTSVLTVTDGAGATASYAVAFTLTAYVDPPLVLQAQPNFTTSVDVGTRVSANVNVSGGTAPYQITVTGAPAGTSVQTNPGSPAFQTSTYGINAQPGSAYISGIANVVGQQGAATVSVVDAVGATATLQTQPFTVVQPALGPLGLSLAPDLPTVVASGSFVDAQIILTGGPVQSLTLDPPIPGLTLSPFSYGGMVSGGLIYGYLQDGTYPSSTLTATRSDGAVATFATQPFVVQDPSIPAIAVRASPPLGTAAMVGQPETAYLTWTGGTGPYTVTTSALSANMAFYGQNGPYDVYDVDPQNLVTLVDQALVAEVDPAVTVTVTDANGLTGSYTTNPVTVTPAVQTGPPLAIAATQEIPSQVFPGSPVTGSYQATGGVPPYVLTYGATAPGMAVSQASGTTLNNGFGGPQSTTQPFSMTGAPFQYGQNPSTTFTVTDASGTTASYTSPGFVVETPGPIVFTANPDLTGGPFTEATAPASYFVTGGVPPYVTTSFTAPDGLVVTGGDGVGPGPTYVVTGTSSILGVNPPITLTVTDSVGTVSTFQTAGFTTVQLGGPKQVVVLPNPDLPSSVAIGSQVAAHYEFFGGTPPYVATFGALPAGLAAAGGYGDVARTNGYTNSYDVTGIPSAVGPNQSFSLDVKDSVGNETTFVSAPMAVTGTAPPLSVSGYLYPTNPSVGQAMTGYAYAEGGVGPYAYALTGTLPNGLVDVPSPDGSGLAIEGGPTTTGTTSGPVVTATDAAGNTASFALPDVVVGSAPFPETLSFTTTGDIPSSQAGKTFSITFAATGETQGGSYKFSVVGLPPSAYFLANGFSVPDANGNGQATLTGTLSAGTYDHVAVVVSDYVSSATYAMAPIVVSPSPPNQLCVVRPFTADGTWPQYEDQPYGSLQFTYGIVGCGVPPYTATIVGETPGDTVLVGVDTGGVHNIYLNPGVFDAARTGTNVVVTFTDTMGATVTFPPFDVVDGLSPSPISDVASVTYWHDHGL